jgi:NAD(P)-dependent dehydrogenase (short-subunit alcohol dehydrogenase family)
MEGLDNKVIAITGGCGDIGMATAGQLAKGGAKVVLLDLLPDAEGGVRAKQVGAVGYRICDQGNRAAVRSVLPQLAREFGRLDVVIINAAVATRRSVLEISEQDWNDHLRVNLSGSFHVAQCAVEIMVGQPLDGDGIRGKVLFTSSWVARLPVPTSMPYVVTKAGVDALTKALAQELAGSQIRVNALAPGIFYAGLTRKLCEEDPSLRQELESMVPLGVLGTPDDAAHAYVYLCSSASNYMTGQVMTVDGGCSVVKRSSPPVTKIRKP